MLQSLTWLLEGAGFLVTAASGEPREFLNQIAERPPQVALIDLTLESFTSAPAASGIDVVRELRENHPQIRSLVLSATHTTEMVDRCYHEGAAGYLYKLTASRETLTDAIREVAMGKRLFPVQLLASNVSDGPNADRRPSLLDGVTHREREVLAYLSTGADNVQIAKSLQITERTVKAHVSNLYRKLRVKNRVELALLARQQGLKVPQRGFAPQSNTPPISPT
jgi:two-component system, NarL family, nitrate/nitrite response regulator NarL